MEKVFDTFRKQKVAIIVGEHLDNEYGKAHILFVTFKTFFNGQIAKSYTQSFAYIDNPDKTSPKKKVWSYKTDIYDCHGEIKNKILHHCKLFQIEYTAEIDQYIFDEVMKIQKLYINE